VSRTVCLGLICATLGSLLPGALPVVALPSRPLLISQTTARDYLKLGAERFARQDYKGAIAAFTEAIRLNPNNALKAFAYVSRAASRANLGDHQGTLNDANQAIQLDPKNVFAYINRAGARGNLGDHQGALNDANRAIQLDPKNVFAYVNRAVARAILGDFQGALDDANQAVQLDQKNIFAYAIRADVHTFLGNFQKALTDANQTIRLNSNVSAGYMVRGNAYLFLGDLQAALQDFNKGIKLEPKSFAGIANRSEVYSLQQNYGAALTDADASIKLNPKYGGGYNARAIAYTGLKNYQKAQTDFEKAVQLLPTNGSIYYWQGLLRLKQGNNQQAITDYQKAIQLIPGLASSKAYEDYSLIAQRKLETPVATQPVMAQQTRPAPVALPPTATAAVNTPAPNVYKIADQTTVLIKGQDSGSGVIISKVGNTYYVLTANHVVATQARQQIVSPDGSKQYPLDYTQVKKVKNLDLAVVQFTSKETYPIAQLGSSENLSQGDIILVSGWPAVAQAITKATLQVTDGRISGFQKGDADGYEMLYTNATAPGMSGGPVFDSRGRVVGIHGRAAGNTNSGKVGINLGIPIHLFLQQAPQAGLNLQQLGLRAEK
jgi:tetratricopeptide (TPR) repeat protein